VTATKYAGCMLQISRQWHTAASELARGTPDNLTGGRLGIAFICQGACLSSQEPSFRRILSRLSCTLLLALWVFPYASLHLHYFVSHPNAFRKVLGAPELRVWRFFDVGDRGEGWGESRGSAWSRSRGRRCPFDFRCGGWAGGGRQGRGGSHAFTNLVHAKRILATCRRRRRDM